ncbi:MAG: DUF5678 domain-containing protein [Chloroflexota bacterium]
MPTVMVESEIYEQMKKTAQAKQASLDELFADAARLYLWEETRRQISEESARYQLQHAEIKKEFAGKYVAMKNGRVVDSDNDFHALYQRVQNQYGEDPIMITLVTDEPVVTIKRRGFQHKE